MDSINETQLIISEMLIGFSEIGLTKYVKCAFILLGILLMVLIIKIIIGNISISKG